MRRAYQFSSLQSFLDIYHAGADLLRDEADFHALTAACLRKAHEQGVVHVEIFFDPQTHTQRGVPFATVVAAIRRALLEGQRDCGITQRLILCFLRHLSAEDAMRTLEQALPFAGMIAAVGLDSSEAAHPPRQVQQGIRARAARGPTGSGARRRGRPGTVHPRGAGPAARASHRPRRACEEDPELLRRLVRERIPLRVCPLSNVKLRVFDRIEVHNLKRLLELGVCVSVNSDDPAYFGGYVLENYVAVQQALGLSRADLALLARNSIESSFLPEPAQRRWLAAIDQVARAA